MTHQLTLGLILLTLPFSVYYACTINILSFLGGKVTLWKFCSLNIHGPTKPPMMMYIIILECKALKTVNDIKYIEFLIQLFVR